MIQHDIVVIGGGPAGMAAAVSAYDSGCKDVVILDRAPQLGGVLMQCIHNGFGLHKLGKELTGPEYADEYVKKIRERAICVYNETTVTKLSADKIITAQSRVGILKIKAKAIILAMGCRERSRGALNITGSRPAGIYSAGTAQNLVNCMGYQVGRKIVILGSGDIGLIMARRMTLEGAKVEAVCEVMPYPGGLTRNIVQCLEDFGIPLYLSTTVVRIHGKKRLEGVTIAQVDEERKPIANTEKYIPCDTLLLSVGLIPENELTSMTGIVLDPVSGGAKVDENCETSVSGIFACGNVLQVHDLVDYVSEEAERAGAAAARRLIKEQESTDSTVVTPGRGVRYVVPQVIRSTDCDVTVFFRVNKPFGKTDIRVMDGERLISCFHRIKVAPGEMEKITIKAKDIKSLKGPLTVELEVLQ